MAENEGLTLQHALESSANGVEYQRADVAALGRDLGHAVGAGQTVRLLVDEQPFAPLSGRVTQVARRARLNHDENEPGAAASQALLGDDRYHVVQIAVDDANLPLLPGAHGTAKITTERSNIGSLVLDSIRRTLQRVL